MSERLTQADKVHAQTYLVKNVVDTDLYRTHIRDKKELEGLIVERVLSLAVDYENPDIKKLLTGYGLDVCWVNTVAIPGIAPDVLVGPRVRGFILPDNHNPANYSRLSFRSDQIKVDLRRWKIKLGKAVPILDFWTDDDKYDSDGGDIYLDGAVDEEDKAGIMCINNPAVVLGYGLGQRLKTLYESGLRVVLDKEAMSVAFCAGMDSISTWDELEEFFPAGAAAAKAVRPMVVDPGTDPEIRATPAATALERLRSLR